MPTVIATSIPKNTPVPIPWRLADPGPLAKTSGSIPSTKASDVITIGRNRRWAARMAASSLHPFFDLHLGELHDQDSILGTSPMSMTSPIWK